jgi:hypothetical protein
MQGVSTVFLFCSFLGGDVGPFGGQAGGAVGVREERAVGRVRGVEDRGGSEAFVIALGFGD